MGLRLTPQLAFPRGVLGSETPQCESRKSSTGLAKRDPTHLCAPGPSNSHWDSMKMRKGMRRQVVEVSEEGGRVLTRSKQGTDSTGTREEKMGIDGQRRSSEVKLQGPQ